MAQKRRFLDVWIVESDTVYREVPYEVVTDWVQQGRLLEDDMLRWSGQAEWFRLGSTPALMAYMPKPETDRAEDQAEMLEPVHVEFAWKRPHGEEDDDPDMIPLIDVSLVLLVFFMMTTTAVASDAFYVKTPPAENGNVTSKEMYWVGINYAAGDKGEDKKKLVYAVGKGGEILKDAGGAQDEWVIPDTDPDRDRALNNVVQALQAQPGEVDVDIKADGEIPSGYVRDLTKKLEMMKGKVRAKYVGVSEPS
jgi:biopolymer transport protein ExbD